MALIELTSKDLLKNWRERINELMQEVKKFAVINHASTETKYGIGTDSKFGHLKLSDNLSSNFDITSGIAATPYAVSEVYKIASNSIQKGERIDGSLEIDTIVGSLTGNADTATLATKAISDEYGNNISDTYATKQEINNIFSADNLNFDGAIKRAGTAIQWRDILTDIDSSFLYQSSYSGYMPALNLKTQDGRVGFGTYKNLCRWDYFTTTNETNTPNSYIDLTSTGTLVSGDLTVNKTITSVGNATFSSNIEVTGVSNLNGNVSVLGDISLGKTLKVTGNTTFNGTLTANSTSKFNEACTMAKTLKVTGAITGGNYSNFYQNLYVNSSSNSLIIRNDGSNMWLLVSDTVNGSWNDLRPFTFNMTTGNVIMNHNVNIGGALGVNGSITSAGTISATKVYNAVFNDYAEFFEKGEETEVGDIIALDTSSSEEKYVKASKENSFVVGVHSDTYGHILGGKTSLEESLKTHIPVGMVGRVYAKVKGKIKKGDYLVLSDIPGVGRKFDKFKDSPLDVFGGSLETSNEEEVKLVKIKLK